MDRMTVTFTEVDLLIQNGFAWRYQFSATLTAAASTSIGFVIGTHGALLMDRDFTSDGSDTTFRLYRETTWSGGSTFTPVNRNDRFWGDTSRCPTTSAATGVTASPSAANLMGSVRMLTTGPKVSSLTGDAAQIVLKPSGSYVVTITNDGSQTAQIGLAMLIIQDRVSTGIFRWP